MGEPSDRGRGRGGRELAALAIAGAPILVLLAARPWGVAIPRPLYLPSHTALEALVAAGGLATFAVQWFAAGSGAFREARARFIGPAFLGAAILTVAHLLSFPGMPGFFGPASTERGIVYWFAYRALTIGALVLAARIDRASDSPLLARRRFLFTGSLALCLSVILLEVGTSGRAPLFFVEGRGLTPLKLGLEALLAVASVAGALLHARAWRRTGEPAAGKLAAALVLSAYAELCFMLYASPYDPFNMVGHVYLVASSWFVFGALFVAALVRPYEELDALRAHVEGELVVTIQRLRAATEQRDDLMRAVSHDLRNPLQIVMLQAQRLLRVAEDERGRRAASGVITAARRIDRILRDLADTARTEGGTLVLARAPVPLRPFLAALLEGADGVLDVSRVDLEVPEDLPPVFADPDRLDRIVVNLVGNALKYSKDRVRVRAEREESDIRIAVVDRGPGVAPDDLPRLFDRYYRGKRRDGEGLGLGLYIVRKLVEAHGGQIVAESRPGEGSSFAMTLPVAPPVPTPAAGTPSRG